MAKVIEFYIPSNFQKRMPSIPPKHRGKVIERHENEDENGLK